MNADQLLKHFDRIGEAPDAVARLRRFILELAVRGKLVEQDPSDEQASELLKRIQAEKAKLVKEGKIKRAEEYTEATSDDGCWEIPSTWRFVRLGAITNVVMGQSPPGSTYLKFPTFSL
jgi:type I restriction enzyme, S subunit